MKKNAFKWLLFFVVLIFMVIFALTSSYFKVSEIKVSGQSRISAGDILAQAQLEESMNIFMINASSAKKNLLKNRYIDSVQIKPDYIKRTVTVKIKERILSGYVEYLNGIYLYIDENGRVLEAANHFTEKLPVVVGLQFSSFNEGELLDVSNKDSFDVVVILAQLFNKYDMGEDVIRVDVQNVSDIHVYIHGIDVEFGTISDADEKIRTVNTVLETLENKEQKGFLNVKDISKPSVFRLLR